MDRWKRPLKICDLTLIEASTVWTRYAACFPVGELDFGQFIKSNSVSVEIAELFKKKIEPLQRVLDRD
jgi:hypothetical protein